MRQQSCLYFFNQILSDFGKRELKAFVVLSISKLSKLQSRLVKYSWRSVKLNKLFISLEIWTSFMHIYNYLMNSSFELRQKTIGNLIGQFQLKNQHALANIQQERDDRVQVLNMDLQKSFAISVQDQKDKSSTSFENIVYDQYQEIRSYKISQKESPWDIESPQVSFDIFFYQQDLQKQEIQMIQKKNAQRKEKLSKNKVIKKEKQRKKYLQPKDSTQKKKRTDGKQATQNAASKAFTITLMHILKYQKDQAKKQKLNRQFKDFLIQNKTKSSQTILVFIYIYLRKLKMPFESFYQIGQKLIKYYELKIAKCDEDITLKRYDVYRQIIRLYYTKYDGKQINLQWFISIFKPLYHGKQTPRINEAIQNLKKYIQPVNLSTSANLNRLNQPYKNIQ